MLPGNSMESLAFLSPCYNCFCSEPFSPQSPCSHLEFQKGQNWPVNIIWQDLPFRHQWLSYHEQTPPDQVWANDHSDHATPLTTRPHLCLELFDNYTYLSPPAPILSLLKPKTYVYAPKMAEDGLILPLPIADMPCNKSPFSALHYYSSLYLGY